MTHPPVVFLCDRQRYETKLDRSRWLSLAPLKPILTGNGFDNYDSSKTVRDNVLRLTGGDDSTLIVAFKPGDHIDFHKAGRTVIQYNECHRKRWPVEIHNCRPKLAIFHHHNDCLNRSEEVRRFGGNPVHIPHCADPNIFYPPAEGSERPIDVLLAGAKSEHIYPLRETFRKAAPLLQEAGLNVHHFQHPGHEFAGAWTNNHLVSFANSCRLAKIVCFCSSIYRYRLQKYVEVAACGAEIAADLPAVQSGELIPLIQCSAAERAGTIAERIIDRISLGLTDEQAAIDYAASYTPASYCRQFLESAFTTFPASAGK